MIINFNEGLKTQKKQEYKREISIAQKKKDEALEVFENKESLAEIIKAFNSLSGLKQCNSYMYRGNGRDYYIGSEYNMRDTVENLLYLQPFRMSSVPEVLLLAASKGGKYQMIAVPSQENYISYKDNKEKASIGARVQFVRQLKDLALDTNLYNPKILENEDDWLLNEDGDIFIEDWSNLKEFTSGDEIAQYFADLKKACGLILY